MNQKTEVIDFSFLFSFKSGLKFILIYAIMIIDISISGGRHVILKKLKNMDWYFVIIILISAILYGWGIWDAGSANSYYTAAIRSMLESWHNFWYGAFDSAGFITVDKPPVALWLMAISAKIFGLHGWSVVLPSVLAGIGSVYLMYQMLTPKFGVWAGRLGALVLTFTPTVVANSRTNNMDAILVFFLLLAVYVLQKAVEKKNIWLVMMSFALVGIGFNVKMLQAFMILPAMLVYYWIAIKVPWKKKILWLGAGLLSLTVFTLAYPVAVDSVDQSNRPYIGSSQHNSLLELAFGYNGTERLLGQSTGTGGAFPGIGTMNNKKSSKAGQQPTGQKSGQPTQQAPTNQKSVTKGTAPSGQAPSQGKTPQNMPTGQAPKDLKKTIGQQPTQEKPSGMRNGKGQKQGGSVGMNNAFAIGTAGPFRLFQSDLGSQIGWFLPLAILGIIAGWFGYRKRNSKWYTISEEQRHVILWSAWLVPVYGFFSIAGFFHPYYTIMLAPAIAALTAIGAAATHKMYQNSSAKTRIFAKSLISFGIVSTLALQAYYVWSYYPMISIALIIVAIILAIWWWLGERLFAKMRLVISIIAICVMAAWWSFTPTLSHNSAAIPFASPTLLTQGGSDSMGSQVDAQLLSYTQQHQGQAKYLFATTDSNSASGYIIKSGKAVMALGGYNGTDPTVTLSEFKQLVKSGQVKYFVMGNKGTSSSGHIGKILSWVQKNGVKVNYSKNKQTNNQNTMGQGQNSQLYDLSTIYQ